MSAAERRTTCSGKLTRLIAASPRRMCSTLAGKPAAAAGSGVRFMKAWQIASTAGIAGYQRRAVYCASKFGVIGLTKVLALDHGRDNVRVNAILPHVVETEMFRTVASPRDKKNWAAEIPMGRFAQVEDVANLAIFLCSPAASYLTGGLYPVDGGAMAGSFGGD